MSSVTNPLLPLLQSPLHRDIGGVICSNLEPQELHDLLTRFKVDKISYIRAWEGIQEKIGYPPIYETNEKGERLYNHYKSYTHFITEKRQLLDSYPTEQVPGDVKEILKIACPSVAQAQKLLAFIKARDTLVVWKKIAEQSGASFTLVNPFGNSDATIATAKGFNEWITQNQDKLRQLQILRLNRSQLTTLPSEVCQLKQLRDLGLNQNRLTTLPPKIGKLGQLKILDLSQNLLAILPSEIGKFGQLEELYLFKNNLTSLPPEIGKLKRLEYLYLFRNYLTSLSPAISQLKKLICLFLQNNRLTSIPSELSKLTQLEELEIQNNPLTTLPSEMGQLEGLTISLTKDPQMTLPSEIRPEQIEWYEQNGNLSSNSG